jgi:AraC-like DNA-binding protein
MFYQAQNSLRADDLKIEGGVDFSYPAHLHGDFEFILITQGEMTVTVDHKPYRLTKGKALLIFPNQLHELYTAERSRHFLCIFSPKLVQAYGKIFLNKIPKSNLFAPSEDLVKRLLSLRGEEGILITKALMYLLCGEFDAVAEYEDREGDRNALLPKIFRFVEEHYQGDCSLGALAEETAYHYAYLSGYFKKGVGISYAEYVNRYRVSEACYLLQNSHQTILKTAMDCGFESLRSFNRNFKRIMGVSPGEYRERF